MYNGVDYPYYEPTSNNSMSWQNHNSQPGAQQQSQSHPSQLPQNQSQTRFNRFNQGHHANGRDDQDHQSQSPAIQAPMGLDPVQPIYQKAFSEVPIQNSKSFHYGGTGGGPGSLAGTGPGSVQYGMDRPYPPTGIMRIPEFSISQSQHSIQQNSIDHQRIMFLEQKMQRLEQDNHILYQQNAKMKNQYTQALDNLASKLVSALVENQIKLDQGQFHSCFTQNQNSSQSLITSQNKRNKGILKSQNKQNYSPFPLDSTSAPQSVCEPNPESGSILNEYLSELKPSSPLQRNDQNVPNPNQINHNLSHNTNMVYSSITRPSMPLTLSPKPEISASVNIQSPRAISNKKVWFPADNVSVGAKSAPAGKVDLPSESEGSGHSDDDSSISSQDSGREQCGDMSFLDDLKQIENDRKKKDKGNSSGAQSSHLPPVSPGRERWSLNRKDSIHSLASEPNKNDPTPFQRGAMSVSSLNRLRSKPKDRVSSCSNDSGSGAAMSPRPVEGTPTSMKAIMEMTNGSNSSPTSVSRNLFCEKKKKKTLKEKIISKFSTKKNPKEGVVRVGTPEGQWHNQSLSPQKTDSDNSSFIKTTPGRKSIG